MIYFIQAGKNGPIKIGYSEKSPYGRLRSLQTANHEELYLIAIMPGNTRTERAIHDKFEYARKRGEWFYPTIRLMRFISYEEETKIRKKHTEPTREYRERMTLELWDSGIHSVSKITQTVYTSDGGNQRNQVAGWLKDNGKI